MRGQTRRWVLPLLIVLVAIAATYALLGRHAGGRVARSGERSSARDLAVPPLSQAQRAKLPSTWAEVADPLRELCNGLPRKAREELIRKGRYDYHVADLPAAQAELMKRLYEDKLARASGMERDVSKLTFTFGRHPMMSDGCVWFLVSDHPGSEWMGGPIGRWPAES